MECPFSANLNTRYTMIYPIDTAPTSPAKKIAFFLKLKKLKIKIDNIIQAKRDTSTKYTQWYSNNHLGWKNAKSTFKKHR